VGWSGLLELGRLVHLGGLLALSGQLTLSCMSVIELDGEDVEYELAV
jgi:hypothetical protein